MPIPEMTEVKSTNLHSVGLCPDTGLYVRFRDKRGMPAALYRYATAGAVHHEALLNSTSPGQHFLGSIRNVHKEEKVDG